MKTAKEMFERNKEMLERNKPIEILNEKLNKLEKVQNDLLKIQSQMEKWLEKGETYFNICSEVDIELVYSIFGNKDQYSFGDERYHWYTIEINKKGIDKLCRLIEKNDNDIKTVENKLEKLNI